jgi:hypothetical protein
MKEIDVSLWSEVFGGRVSSRASGQRLGAATPAPPADSQAGPEADALAAASAHLGLQAQGSAAAAARPGAAAGLPPAPGQRTGLLLIELPEQDKLGLE